MIFATTAWLLGFAVAKKPTLNRRNVVSSWMVANEVLHLLPRSAVFAVAPIIQDVTAPL